MACLGQAVAGLALFGMGSSEGWRLAEVNGVVAVVQWLTVAIFVPAMLYVAGPEKGEGGLWYFCNLKEKKTKKCKKKERREVI